jgi:hypothetical protein
LNLNTAADFKVREHRQRTVEALGNGVDIRARFRRRHKSELMTRIHKRLHHPSEIGAKLLDQARLDIELDDLALRVALESLMERKLPFVS